MSWFRRTPHVKEEPKHLPHRKRSPMTEKIIQQSNETRKLNESSFNVVNKDENKERK